TWHLFGWQTMAFPTTMGIQGLPGQLFNRTAQIRLSHTFKTSAVDVELAVAALRPPQRNAGGPDGAAGLRISVPSWTGMQTINSTGTQIAPFSFGVSGVAREFRVPEWAAKPVNTNSVTGYGVALDLFAPIVPATKEAKGNSLSLTGEFAYGRG